MTDVLYLFAIEREATPFRQMCPRAAVEVVGVGSIAAVAAGRAIEKHHPKQVIMAGFAGALREDLRVGDVIVAQEVLGEPEALATGATRQVHCSNDEMMGPACSRWRLDSGRLRSRLAKTTDARMLTTKSLVADSSEKRQFGEQFNADAVDMESADVARVCSDANVPLICVRAISDTVDTALSPRLTTLIAGGRVSIVRTLLAIARQPSLLPEMLRLARDSRIAAQRLAESLTQLALPGEQKPPTRLGTR